MKLQLMLLIGLGLTIGCTSRTNDESTPVDKMESHDSHAQVSEAGLPALNNGARWKADAPTIQHVSKLQQVIVAFNNTSEHSIDQYHQLGTDLKQGIDVMIKECRMQGADHDALHTWLQPLPGQVKELSSATSVASATELVSAINKRLVTFNTYFE